MRFKRINIKNFLSVGEIEFNFNYTSGITLIKGRNNDISANASNASGKSILQDAIFFVLFGKPLRNIKQEDIINRHAKKNCRVELEFDNIKIIRTLKPNSLTFFVDGKEISTDASVTESKKILEKYLDISYESLCNILCFGQHNLVSFFDTTEAARREIIENLMNLREYNLYEEKTKEKTKELKSNIKSETEKFNISEQHLKKQQIILSEQHQKHKNWKESIEKEIISIDDEIKSLPSIDNITNLWNKYTKYVELMEVQESSLQKLTIEKLKINEKIQELLNNKNQKIKETSYLQEVINQCKDSWIKYQEEKNNELSNLTELKEQISSLEKEYSEVKQDEEIIKNLNIYKSKVDESLKLIERVKNKELNEGDVCPSCFGPIKIENKDNYIQHLTKHLNEFQNKYNETKLEEEKDLKKIQALKLKINNKKKEISDLYENEVKKIEDKYNEIYIGLKAKAQENKDKIKKIEEEAEKEYLEKSSIESNLLNEINNKVKSIKEKEPVKVQKPEITLEKLKDIELKENSLKEKVLDKQKTLKNNPFDNVIKDLEKSVKESEKETQDIRNIIGKSEEDVPYYDFWLNAFGKNGIKAFVVDQIVPVLNQQINYWLGLLYNNNIEINFDKYLNANIQNKSSNYELSFFGGSGGEKRRMDLSVMLAFRQIMKLASGKDPNLIFFDEIVESLDEPGVNCFYETVKELSQTCHVYIITHNQHLLELLKEEKFITFEKNKGITSLVRK